MAVESPTYFGTLQALEVLGMKALEIPVEPVNGIAARFPDGTRISRPAGGFLLWVQLPEGTDTVELQRRALTHGLSVAPGPAFSASGAYRNYMRVNAGYRWSARNGEALDLLAELVREIGRVDGGGADGLGLASTANSVA